MRCKQTPNGCCWHLFEGTTNELNIGQFKYEIVYCEHK